ncbi:multiple sugar transport system substrate-binding protein [Fontibacillus phaseoli]|uniref:Multiple sugar transport system substrate-binding protein n=1 Tax=Fontibacillus phaseoli TaxID=1416533 RepID=A0A369BES3_9BACL|nr:extracellular solute-binding protein [Fontibacillus phaseoli]RCX18987.1 multiple sugar transport system substrate-binding protein [Fontibacillus phaseoli]
MKFKWLHKSSLLVVSSLLLIAGCSGGPAKESQKEQQSLKIMFGDEGYFYMTYGDLFTMKYPNIDIEVVSTQNLYNGEQQDYKKAYKDFVEKEQPDIIMLDTDNYDSFASEGQLMELDTLIDRDKYDTSTIFPGLIDLLKERAGGKLYGLAPSFYGNAIYYNADLFAKYGVEVPHDGMTWQELIDTARRFPVEGDEKTRIYGFGEQYGGMTLENLASRIASTQGLQAINPNTMKVTLNTDSWKQAYKTAFDALESNAIYSPKDGGFQGGSMEEYYQSQPFLMGRMAMTMDGSYFLQNFKQAKSAIKDYKPFQLGIVAGPVDPATPDQTRDIYFGRILSIRANSPNVDAAWEFIKFVNGDEYAKIKSRTMNDGVLSRMGATKEYDGISLEPFYKLKPMFDNSNQNMDKIPGEFYQKYQPIVSREMDLVQKKSKSIDEALRTIEQEGQAQLDIAVKEQANKKKSDASGNESAGGGAAAETSVTVESDSAE